MTTHLLVTGEAHLEMFQNKDSTVIIFNSLMNAAALLELGVRIPLIVAHGSPYSNGALSSLCVTLVT